jgi:Arc/MetJ-type ribon-helix-helix transcriptional regulator
MKRITVRLDDDDARMVDVLRNQGVVISRVVREAIRQEMIGAAEKDPS